MIIPGNGPRGGEGAEWGCGWWPPAGLHRQSFLALIYGRGPQVSACAWGGALFYWSDIQA